MQHLMEIRESLLEQVNQKDTDIENTLKVGVLKVWDLSFSYPEHNPDLYQEFFTSSFGPVYPCKNLRKLHSLCLVVITNMEKKQTRMQNITS